MRKLLHELILSIAAPRSLNRMQLLRNEKLNKLYTPGVYKLSRVFKNSVVLHHCA